MKNSFDTIIQVLLMVTVAAFIVAMSSDGTMQVWTAIISGMSLIATVVCFLTPMFKNK